MNIPFTLFSKETGQVLSGGTAANPNLLENENTAVLVGEIYTSGWIDEGGWNPVPGNPPSHWHEFDFTTKQWVDPRTIDEAWTNARFERDRRLAASDWTQLPDVPLATKGAWAVYRQALRDITQQPDPFNIAWPVAPG